MRWQILLILMGLIMCFGCQDNLKVSKEQSEEAARQFILDSPTYKFDGSNLVLNESNSLGCENCYVFIFHFTSRSAGYGDRPKQGNAEVITDHDIIVITSKGEVIEAIIDNVWNEITQTPVKDYEVVDTQSSSRVPVYYCTEPRPQACDGDVLKVCSSEKNDYDNPCLACKDTMTKWYVKGECNTGIITKAIDDISAGKITSESGPLIVFWGWQS